MNIKIVNYAPATSPTVQAFVDVTIDGWLRLNGLNYDRNGGLRSAQLTFTRNGKRNFVSAVAIIDSDLRELLKEDILGAINKYVANLPPEQRTRPPKPPAVKPEKVALPVTPKLAEPAAKPALAGRADC